jgi:hypothetical protein
MQAYSFIHFGKGACRAKAQCGVAAIEAAISLPLLLILLCFAMDGVGVFQAYATANNFAREVARSAAGIPDFPNGEFDKDESPPGDGDPSVRALFNRADFLLSVFQNEPVVNYGLTVINDGELISVTAVIPYKPVVGEQLFLLAIGSPYVAVEAYAPRLID